MHIAKKRLNFVLQIFGCKLSLEIEKENENFLENLPYKNGMKKKNCFILIKIEPFCSRLNKCLTKIQIFENFQWQKRFYKSLFFNLKKTDEFYALKI